MKFGPLISTAGKAATRFLTAFILSCPCFADFHHSKLAPRSNGSTTDSKHKEIEFVELDRKKLSEMHPIFQLLWENLCSGDRHYINFIISRLPQEIRMFIHIPKLDQNQDNEGRTLYLYLPGKKPYKLLRLKGVRLEMDQEGNFRLYEGKKGFPRFKLSFSEDGKQLIRVANRKGVSGGCTFSESEREFRTTEKLLKAHLPCDALFALAKWPHRKALGESLGFSAFGMTDTDFRIARGRSTQREHSMDVMIENRANGEHLDVAYGFPKEHKQAARLAFHRKIGFLFRKLHDIGVFHQFPHIGNIGIETRNGGKLDLILRDLDNAVFANDIPKQQQAAYRLKDIYFLIREIYMVVDMEHTTGLLSVWGDEKTPSSLQYIRPLLEGYFPEIDPSSPQMDAIVKDLLSENFYRTITRLMRGETESFRLDESPFKNLFHALQNENLDPSRVPPITPECFSLIPDSVTLPAKPDLQEIRSA